MKTLMMFITVDLSSFSSAVIFMFEAQTGKAIGDGKPFIHKVDPHKQTHIPYIVSFRSEFGMPFPFRFPKLELSEGKRIKVN